MTLIETKTYITFQSLQFENKVLHKTKLQKKRISLSQKQKDPRLILSSTTVSFLAKIRKNRLFEKRLCTRPFFPDFLILALVIMQLWNA